MLADFFSVPTFFHLRPGGFLYTWDGGNQLTYPIKYHDIGYKEPPPPTTDPPDTRQPFTAAVETLYTVTSLTWLCVSVTL